MTLVAGCDDGFVDKSRQYTVVACVFYDERLPRYVRLGLVRIDGLDVTSILAALLGLDVDVVFLDTLIYAGFNIVSIPGLKKLIGSKVIAFYPYKPSYERLAEPIRKHLSNARLRLRLLSQLEWLREVETGRGTVYSVDSFRGPLEVRSWIERYQFFSRIPEPLRVAHMVASQSSMMFLRRKVVE